MRILDLQHGEGALDRQHGEGALDPQHGEGALDLQHEEDQEGPQDEGAYIWAPPDQGQGQ